MARNILGTDLETCCMDPVTGYYRNGKCDTGGQDRGLHTVCVRMTDAFLAFAKNQGNDLITPMPQHGFPGLKDGDHWCVCVGTVMDAMEENVRPKIKLEATHASVLELISLEDLRACAVED